VCQALISSLNRLTMIDCPNETSCSIGPQEEGKNVSRSAARLKTPFRRANCRAGRVKKGATRDR